MVELAELFDQDGRLDASEAARIGLLHRAVPEKQLDAAVQAEIERLRAVGPLAVMEAKRLVHRIAKPDVKERRALDEENADLIARLRVSEEGQEGLNAFFAKRRPKWGADRSPPSRRQPR